MHVFTKLVFWLYVNKWYVLRFNSNRVIQCSLYSYFVPVAESKALQAQKIVFQDLYVIEQEW